MKCANCNNDAQYVYKITNDHTILYCAKDLPKFLDERRKAGLLETVAAEKAPEPTPEPTPTKKPSKKSAATDADNS